MEITPSTKRFLGASSYASALRQELSARNIIWAESNGFLHECTLGALPSVLYRADDQQRHGNFHPASYKRILNNPAWKRRLAKVHTTARKRLLSHDPDRQELDSCNSSDALLMSVFCHPSTQAGRAAFDYSWAPIRKRLSTSVINHAFPSRTVVQTALKWT
jgi:hypothetical protein